MSFIQFQIKLLTKHNDNSKSCSIVNNNVIKPSSLNLNLVLIDAVSSNIQSKLSF